MNTIVEADFLLTPERTAGETVLPNEEIPASSSGFPRPERGSSRQGAPGSHGRGAPARGQSRLPEGLCVLFLFTCDPLLQQTVEEALTGTAALVHIARNVGHALHIISAKGGECHLAIIDADQELSAIVLLQAFESSRVQVPIVLAVSSEATYAKTVASRGRSITCFDKPVPATVIAAGLSYPPTPTPACAAA